MVILKKSNTVDDVIGYKRTYQGQEIICLCNFTNTEQPIPDIQGNILLDNYNDYNQHNIKTLSIYYDQKIITAL